VLDVQSNNKGLLLPRLSTEQRNSITAPAIGLQIYNLDTDCIQIYMPVSGWKNVLCDSEGGQGSNCPTTVSDVDGNVYPTVKIGGKCWMKENLNTTKDASGSGITRHCYENNSQNCDNSGGLYTWNTAMNGASSSNAIPSNVLGICPTGWHLPSDAEWCDFETILGLQNACATNFFRGEPLGTELKAATPVWNGTDTHGFSAIESGWGNSVGGWPSADFVGFWSSTENSANLANAWFRALAETNDGVNRNSNTKT